MGNIVKGVAQTVEQLGNFTTELPFFSAAQSASNFINTVSDRDNRNRASELEQQQNQALEQLQQRQALDQQILGQQSALDKTMLAQETHEEEEKRRKALKRAVARQRASFGASGLSSGDGGSAQAVLLGLFDESDDERAERERFDALRTQAIDLNTANQNSLNVLQRSQLRERQNLARQFSKDRIGSERSFLLF